jgi:predicted nucleic acid-binding protein
VILYADTSALVKLYVTEPGSTQVRAAVQRCVALCSHAIAYVEMRAAFAGAERRGRLNAAGLARLVSAFEQDWETMRKIRADTPLLRRAGALAESEKLRAYDAIHLAAAERAAHTLAGLPFRFAAFDEPLNRAAAALGLSLIE